jgi:hypothetical protein
MLCSGVAFWMVTACHTSGADLPSTTVLHQPAEPTCILSPSWRSRSRMAFDSVIRFCRTGILLPIAVPYFLDNVVILLCPTIGASGKETVDATRSAKLRAVSINVRSSTILRATSCLGTSIFSIEQTVFHVRSGILFLCDKLHKGCYWIVHIIYASTCSNFLHPPLGAVPIMKSAPNKQQIPIRNFCFEQNLNVTCSAVGPSGLILLPSSAQLM